MSTQTLTSTTALFGRLTWMFVGPFALAIVAITIAERHGGWLGPFDVIYFVILVGMLLGRRLEFRHSRPMTAAGEPATVDDLRRYSLVLGLLGPGVWLVVHLVGNQVLRILG